MSLQVLTQTYAPSASAVIRKVDQEDTTKDLYAQYSKGGVLLFLRTADIADSNVQFVYFMVYSMFPNITVYWGVFDKFTNNFIFDSGCIGNLKKLNEMLSSWKRHGYQYTANIVQDQITPRINKYLDITPKKGQIQFDYPLYSLFRRVINSIKYGSPVNSDDLLKFKSVIFETFIKDPEFKYSQGNMDHIVRLYEYQIDQTIQIKMPELEKQMRLYENNINRIDIDRDIRIQMGELQRITNLFFDKIKHGEYFYHNRVTELCPEISECDIRKRGLCGAYDYGYNILYVEDIF